MGAHDWDEALQTLNPRSRDIYFTGAYHQLHQTDSDCTPPFSLIEEGTAKLLVCGLRSQIPGSPYADIETCNGYGGPLVSAGADSDFVANAWRLWKARCREEGIVAAFFRLHPLLENDKLLPQDAIVQPERKTVFVDLSSGTDVQLKRAASRHRNMVSKATRENASVTWNDPEDWAGFICLYKEAMLRINAPQRLCFTDRYFSALRLLPGVELAAIRGKGSLDAAAVFLFGEIWGHYHLAARSADSPNYAMNFLLQAAFERAAANGIEGVHLGGGTTTAPDDSLFRFKRSAGGELLDFKVGLVIADFNAYDKLCRDWSSRTGARPSWLLGYRQPYERKNESVTPVNH